MIFKDIIENANYMKSASKFTIGFCSIILEDNHATCKNKKMDVDINIRTKLDGGRNNSPILHGPAVKIKYDKDLVDIFIIKDGNKYHPQIDRHYNSKKAQNLASSKIYKITNKFIEKNGKELYEIWETREDSAEYQKLIKRIKQNNPEFNYSK